MEAKKPKGCLFWGCLTVIVIGVFGAALVGLAGFGLYSRLPQVVEWAAGYTETAPRPLPAAAAAPGQAEQLQRQLSAFRAALDEGKPAQLTLTADDMNILIASDKDLSPLKDKVHVWIRNEEVGADFSVPLDDLFNHFDKAWLDFLKLQPLQGRYLNGSTALEANLKPNDSLIVRIRDIEVKGQRLPEPILAELRAKNLAEKAYEKPENAAAVRHLQRVAVADGRLVVESKGGQ
jgi:hypothetical protein